MYTGKSECLKCGEVYEDEKMFEGCPKCKTDKFVSNVAPIYDYKAKDFITGLKQNTEKNIFKYKALLPFKDKKDFISLSEGLTPTVKFDRLSQEIGINLYAKDESRNPTWSQKDRLNAVLINKAIDMKAPGTVFATTGNNGASGAAYAAKAGMPCLILTVKTASPSFKAFMQVYGAAVVALETYEDRWILMEKCVNEFGWYPGTNFVDPLVGSNAWGNEGYKTIAYEIFEQMETLPDKFVVPISIGDGLFGIYKGFDDLKNMGLIEKIPQMVSVENFGPLYNAISKNLDYIPEVPSRETCAASMSITKGAYQAMKAIKESKGEAVLIDTDEPIMQAQKDISKNEGLYCEPASASCLAAVRQLVERKIIKENESVVMLLTSTGVKDTISTAKYLPEVPYISPEMGELSKALKNSYGVSL
ncbi:MAG: pyridoxal-phosphate dependent enzyme [Desulfobacterales bacterium]|nr:pyridoxal-phosphate dependent enzyme [Desulfobacterales bacterium]